jgi:hypothetical protein
VGRHAHALSAMRCEDGDIIARISRAAVTLFDFCDLPPAAATLVTIPAAVALSPVAPLVFVDAGTPQALAIALAVPVAISVPVTVATVIAAITPDCALCTKAAASPAPLKDVEGAATAAIGPTIKQTSVRSALLQSMRSSQVGIGCVHSGTLELNVCRPPGSSAVQSMRSRASASAPRRRGLRRA